MRVTRIVNTVFSSNTYILSPLNSNNIWLIDIGDFEPILDVITNAQTIKGVFITHTHYDHIYGIRELVQKFPNCFVYTSEYGREGFLSDLYNFSRYHDDHIVFDNKNIRILKEGEIIKLTNNDKIEVFETPGHDWSCLTYKLGENSIFTGDSYIPGQKVVIAFPKSSKEKSENSLKKILELLNENTIVYPGHGEIGYPQ